MKRLDYIRSKVDWFGDVRDKKVLEICMDCWKAHIKRYTTAKRFLIRSIKGVDSLIANEFFSKWKNYMFEQRKQVFFSNIEELERRQEEHEN
jgi:hypothetical protein